MKVVIQSNCGPYGLPRHALEAASTVLPARIIGQIDQLVVVAKPWGPEPFEYDPKRRIAYFAYPGDPNREEVREGALRELLLGFARLDVGGEFRIPLTARQRDDLSAFVDQWYPVCLKAINDQAV